MADLGFRNSSVCKLFEIFIIVLLTVFCVKNQARAVEVNSSPAFSPDSKYISFAVYDLNNTNTTLYTVPAGKKFYITNVHLQSFINANSSKCNVSGVTPDDSIVFVSHTEGVIPALPALSLNSDVYFNPPIKISETGFIVLASTSASAWCTVNVQGILSSY